MSSYRGTIVLGCGELAFEAVARAGQVVSARADSLGAQAPAGSRQPIAERRVPSGPGASRAH